MQYNSRSSGSATGDALHRIVHRAEIRYRNSRKLPHNIYIRDGAKYSWKLGIYCTRRNMIFQEKLFYSKKGNINLGPIHFQHIFSSFIVVLSTFHWVLFVPHLLLIEIFPGKFHFKIIFLQKPAPIASSLYCVYIYKPLYSDKFFYLSGFDTM